MLMAVTRDKISAVALRSSGVLSFLLLWEMAPRLGWVDPFFAPPFTAVLGAIHDLAVAGSLAQHLVISIWRGLTSLLVASLVAIPAGFILALRLPAWAVVLDPFLRVLSQVNPFSLMPVFVLFFGIGETAKIMVIAWVSFWPILFYTISAVRTVDPLLLKTGRSLGISNADLYLKVIFPASIPVLFVGLRIGAALVFFMIVAAEMLGANAGLGWLVHNAAMNYQVPRIYAGAALIIVLGFLLNRILLSLERSLFAGEQDAADPLPTGRRAASSWQPGWRSALTAAAALLLFLMVGGREVYLSNLSSADMGESGRHQVEAEVVTGGYICPMHTFVIRDRPEKCPICGMNLELKGAGEAKP